ncbi:diheme cytochrome c [Sulfuricystis multivorans]|uniref:diheme cytochrome c n=1 Tax=Sulfuricystis multivorans TaxID=2211108 RepID=UPI000F83D725|nr:diheme cytochrome c [Sulfuricystis multivorans]
MKIKNFFIGIVLVSLSATALADKHGLPADAPPAYQAECASCHVAYPPRLLTADDWRRVMASLDKHYGDNASLDEPTRRAIEGFLIRNAGSPSKVGARKTASASALPRLTATPWFERKHREVSRRDWAHPKVKTPANCAACHTQAAQGSYREREIVMPSGRRWEGD